MRILVHTIFYKPELTGVAKYMAELCEWLTAQGHEVRVMVVLQLSIGVRWAHRSGAERRSMPRAQAANSKSLLMN